MRDRPHSYSSLSTLATCSEMYRLSYVLGLEDPATNLPMEAGSAIDAALNHLYVTEWEIDGALERLRASWGDTKPPMGAKHSWLTQGFLEERIALYMEEREASPTILEEGEILSDFSGEMHAFDWHGPDGNLVRVRGIPDFALKADGKVYAVDVKSMTQWVNDWWLMQFRVGHQLRIYAAMLQNLLGVEVAGGLINAVYMGEKALDDADKWKRRRSAPSALHVIDFTQEQINEAHEWVRGLEAQERLHHETGLWPRNEKACGLYGGCSFIPLCTAGSDNMRRALMTTRYRQKEERK